MEQESSQFVIFRVSAEEYGLPIEQVSSIIKYEQPTPIPRAPEEVQGVINLRGMVVPVVDLRQRFTGSAGDSKAPFERIVVTDSDLGLVGLAVDEASEVATIPTEEIKSAPETALTAETAEAFKGVVNLEDRLVILLRLDKAIPHEDYVQLAAQEGEDDV